MKRIEFSKGSLDRLKIELGFQRKMVSFVVELKLFKFDKGNHGGKDVIILRTDGFGG